MIMDDDDLIKVGVAAKRVHQYGLTSLGDKELIEALELSNHVDEYQCSVPFDSESIFDWWEIIPFYRKIGE